MIECLTLILANGTAKEKDIKTLIPSNLTLFSRQN
jgi:hypothetical protein